MFVTLCLSSINRRQKYIKTTDLEELFLKKQKSFFILLSGNFNKSKLFFTFVLFFNFVPE